MKIVYLIFYILTFSNSCLAAERDTLYIYYSKNQSFINIIDSISSINQKNNVKVSFQKQTFLVHLFKIQNNDLLMHIDHYALFDDEYGDKYIPFGCVIKNDSFFYLINHNVCKIEIDSLFKRTEERIIPKLHPGIDKIYEIDKNGNMIFKVWRWSKEFRLHNEVFEDFSGIR